MYSRAGTGSGGVFMYYTLPFISLISLPPPFLKYAKYMENHSIEGVRNVFKRACMIHLPRKPAIHLLWGAFEEQQGKCKHLSQFTPPVTASSVIVKSGFASIIR